MAHGVLYPIFGCPGMHLLSQLTSNFQEKVISSALETASGVTSLGQLVNALNWNTDLFTHAFVCILSFAVLSACSMQVLYEQTRIAATRLVFVVILNSIKTISGPVSNGRALKISS